MAYGIPSPFHICPEHVEHMCIYTIPKQITWDPHIYYCIYMSLLQGIYPLCVASPVGRTRASASSLQLLLMAKIHGAAEATEQWNGKVQ